MGRTSAEVKNRYNAKVYDQLAIRVPKGRRADIEAFTREHGESINGMVNRLIQAEMGITDSDWGGEPKMKTLAQVRRFLKDHGFSIRKKDKGQDSWIVFDDNCHIVAMGENNGVSLEEVQNWINEGIDKGEW